MSERGRDGERRDGSLPSLPARLTAYLSEAYGRA